MKDGGKSTPTCSLKDDEYIGTQMTTLTEDDVLEQLDAQNNLLSFMTTAHNILLGALSAFCRRCLSIMMKKLWNMQ